MGDLVVESLFFHAIDRTRFAFTTYQESIMSLRQPSFFCIATLICVFPIVAGSRLAADEKQKVAVQPWRSS